MLVEAGSAILKLPEVYQNGLTGVATKVDKPQGEEPLPPGFAFFLFPDIAPIATLGLAQEMFEQLRAQLSVGAVGELFTGTQAGDVQ